MTKTMTNIPGILQSAINMFNGLSANTAIGKLLIAATTVAASFISPITGLLLACFCCSVIDMVYGIKVAKKQHKKITSQRSWHGTLSKIRDEFVLILLAHLLEYVTFGGDVCILSCGVTVIMTLTEMWSILENLNTLNPNGPWKSLGKFLKKKGEDYVGIEIDLNKQEHDNNNTVVIEES